jgi:pyrroloquinoline-quinone synthase
VIAARHRADSEWFWAELRLIGRRWNVLKHPFYTRWSAGELTSDELRLYAEEYDHLVVALAAASRCAAGKADGRLADALSAHATEEEEHVALWRDFAAATGWGRASAWAYDSDSLPETVECARVWAGDEARSLALDLVSLYVMEGPQPEIARTKLDGLLELYGYSDGPATAYFRLHSEVDREHAALAQSALDGVLHGADPCELLAQAHAVHRSYWGMLDGLERVRGS